MTEPTIQDELYRKALDQLSHLLASYEAGRIEAESFRTGVETIWACLGGVLDTVEFRELMQDANAEVARLPEPSHTKFYAGKSSCLIGVRKREKVHVIQAAGKIVPTPQFDTEDDAVDFFDQRLLAMAIEQGMRRVAP